MAGKIVFIHLFNDRSGSPKVLSDVIKLAEINSLDYDLITSNGDGFLGGYMKNTTPLFYKRSDNKIVTLFYYLCSQFHLAYICLRYKNLNAVFYINTMMPFSAAIIGKLFGCKVVYHVHETSIRPAVLKAFLRMIICYTADTVIFVSEYLKNKEPFKNVNSEVVYNAIDSSAIHNIENEIDFKCDRSEFNVLMVCSLKKYKGVLEFVELSRGFIENKEYSFSLVLNASEVEIESFFENIDIPVNLTFFSRQNDLTPFYRNASVVLNLSRPDEWIETFGLTIVEAMAFAIPVIAPQVGGPAEIIHEGDEGYLLSCYDISGIANKIMFLNNNKSVYRRMAINSRKRALDFNIDIFNTKILHFLKIDTY